jgi:hypothetical protein
MNEFEQKQKRNKYYLYGLLPVFILWIVVTVLFGIMASSFFLIGFLWPFLYYTPGFKEKACSQSYKYSLLGNAFKIQNWIFSQIRLSPAKWKWPLGRNLIPLLIALFVVAINPIGSAILVIFGAACFELLIYCDQKMNLGFFNGESLGGL